MISFLNPWVLAGLVAAGIPLVLHLLARREPPTVVFPAVRYLITTTREHQRRLKLQNWLLLLLRTLLIVLLVTAAAGPTMRLRGVPGHAPSALVLILDNSPSSGAVAAGAARLGALREAARGVLQRANPADALWLVAADGVPRRGDPAALTRLVDSLDISAHRLDLGVAIRQAAEVLAPEQRPGEIVVVSDLQRTALSAATPEVPLTVARPDEPRVANVGIATLETGPQPWSGGGGRIGVSLVGDSGDAAPVSVRIGDRPPRQALAVAGGQATIGVPAVPAGWWTVEAELRPDELRVDDRRTGVVRVAPVARVDWNAASRYVVAACEVLAANGRIAAGGEVTLGALGAGVSVVSPPEDPAELGALNRALAARGVAWRFGMPVAAPVSTDSGAILGRERVLRRYTLEPAGSGRTGVLATAGGAPWLVRSGGVVLIGSRLDPAWTDLPVSAGFMPFMDVLLNRVARGELALVAGTPGEPVQLPDLVTEVRRDDRSWTVEGGGLFRPLETGIHFLLAGRDTVGALTVNLDPRESLLEPATDREIRQLWRGAYVVDLDEAAPAAFSAAARGDLRGPLLWMAVLVGLAEVGLASAWRRKE